MIAAGTGVSPMLQVIDFYLSRLHGQFPSSRNIVIPDLYLMWIIKSEEYNYSSALGLEQRIESSKGKFKFTVIYSSSEDKLAKRNKVEQAPKTKTKTTLGWTFKEIVDKTTPSRDAVTGTLRIRERLGMKRTKKV